MLMLTDTAVAVIQEIVDNSDFTPDAGLRFSLEAASEDEAQLNVALAPAPQQGDEKVEADGAHVFLDPIASQALDDKVLDATIAPNGEVGFSFSQQPGSDGRPA